MVGHIKLYISPSLYIYNEILWQHNTWLGTKTRTGTSIVPGEVRYCLQLSSRLAFAENLTWMGIVRFACHGQKGYGVNLGLTRYTYRHGTHTHTHIATHTHTHRVGLALSQQT